MIDHILKKHSLLQSMEMLILILFITIEQCCCFHSNSSQLLQPRNPSTNDTKLVIILFCVTSGLLLAVVFFCVFKWCCRRFCKAHKPNQSTECCSAEEHNRTTHEYCSKCLALADYPSFPQQMYGQPPYSETHNTFPQSQMNVSRVSPLTMNIPPTALTEESSQDIVSHQNTNNPIYGCTDGHAVSFQNGDKPHQLSVQTIGMFHQIEGTLQELLIPTEQSVVKTVAGKRLVYITHEVDSNGDVLTLDNLGVSLSIPRNAVAVGKKQPITLALSWDLSDAPSLDSSQANVSPVIYCGPRGLKLEKPCILSYKHCAYDPKNIKIMVSETEITEEKNWELLCCAQEDGGKCVVTLDQCHVRLNRLSLLTSTQLTVEGNAGKKWLQVAVFASPLVPAVNHYQIRVYFFNKTPCNLQWVIFHEAQFGGKLVCPEKTFLFSGGGEDMRIKLHYISECWIPVDETGSDKVSFLQIWHNQCPHASMCFKRSDRHKATCKGSMDEINIQFLMFQENHEDGTEKIIIHMAKDRILEDISDLRSTKHGFDSVNIHLGSSANAVSGSPIVRVRQTSDTSHDIRVELGHEERVDLDDIQQSLSERQTIPVILKHQLVLMLDPRCPFNHDWRELAARLGLDKVIPYLEGKYSPTSIILQHLENKGKTLLELYNILKEMEREDAASFVEKYLLNPQYRISTEFY